MRKIRKMFHVPLTHKKMSHSFVQSQRQVLSLTYNKNQSFHANQVEMIEPLKINGFADTRDELVNAIKAR